jgi:hypothetical protein
LLSEVIDADGRVSSGIPLKEFLKGLKFSNSFSYEILPIISDFPRYGFAWISMHRTPMTWRYITTQPLGSILEDKRLGF